MRTFNVEAFDEAISGTGTTWYSAAKLNSLLGSADSLAIQAWVTNASGTTPTITVQLEHSGDAENWLPVAGSPEISTAVSSNAVYYGSQVGFIPMLLGYVRLRVSMGGTSPGCRLKLHVTGRTLT